MKVPYEIIAMNLDKLYAMPASTDKQVAEMALAIDNFIIACGWTTDEFWTAWLSYNEGVDIAQVQPYIVDSKLS